MISEFCGLPKSIVQACRGYVRNTGAGKGGGDKHSDNNKTVNHKFNFL